MAKHIRKPKLTRTQKQKLRISTKIIIAGSASILSLVAGIFIYLNVSNVEDSKAKEGVLQLMTKPVDFNQPTLLVKQTDITINGIRIKKAIDLATQSQ
jgi:hypothetical protein